MNNKLAALIVAECDASGAYDPERLSKIASVLTGVLGGLASGATSSYGQGAFWPAALGGYIAGDRYGLSGVAGSIGAQAGISGMKGEQGEGPLGRLVGNTAGDNPEAQRMAYGLLRAGAPIAAGKAIDWASKEIGDED
jgi:hypothetical protein